MVMLCNSFNLHVTACGRKWKGAMITFPCITTSPAAVFEAGACVNVEHACGYCGEPAWCDHMMQFGDEGVCQAPLFRHRLSGPCWLQ